MLLNGLSSGRQLGDLNPHRTDVVKVVGAQVAPR
jgi:hypothetical protein